MMGKLTFLWTLLSVLIPATVLAYTFEPEIPENIKLQMQQDLQFVGTIKGDIASELHTRVFGSVDGQNYSKFFEDRVKLIGLDDCGDEKAVACVIPLYAPSEMWITQNYIKFSHPQIARIMVVFHESRHTEGSHGYWSHATCPVPFIDKDGKEIKSIWTGASLAGEAACDKTALGSYGSSMIMLKNIQKFCTTCTEKVKMDAGIYADDQYKRIVDRSAAEQIRKDLYLKPT